MIDLRTIVPLDVETIVASVAKTGRLLVVDEGFAMCGLGAEIAAAMMEHAFDELDAPVGRLHTDPVAHPFSPAHENAVVVSVDRIVSAVHAVVARKPLRPRCAQRTARDRPQPRPRTSAVLPQTTATASAPAIESSSGVPLIMPNQDLTIREARVLQWLKRVGDAVSEGEPVVEVETDKAVMTVDAPLAGRLAEIVAPPGTVVPLGGQLGTIHPGEN